jgi:hypothetical protein
MEPVDVVHRITETYQRIAIFSLAQYPPLSGSETEELKDIVARLMRIRDNAARRFAEERDRIATSPSIHRP